MLVGKIETTVHMKGIQFRRQGEDFENCCRTASSAELDFLEIPQWLGIGAFRPDHIATVFGQCPEIWTTGEDFLEVEIDWLLALGEANVEFSEIGTVMAEIVIEAGEPFLLGWNAVNAE